MMARMRIYVLALAAMLCFVGIGRESRGDNERTASQMYRRYCVSCHGSDGKAKTSKGRFSHARDLTDAQWQDDVSDERIYNSIMNGRNVRGNMPAFSNKLNDKEADSLVSFVRGLKAQ
jgi:mono/diheme cytochrome c family protein